MRLLLTLGIRVTSSMEKSQTNSTQEEPKLPGDELKAEELYQRKLRAFRCYARSMRELEDCESILRDAWASLSCIRGLLQEQTAVMTKTAEIFEI